MGAAAAAFTVTEVVVTCCVTYVGAYVLCETTLA